MKTAQEIKSDTFSLCECVETTERVGVWNDVTAIGSERTRELDRQ